MFRPSVVRLPHSSLFPRATANPKECPSKYAWLVGWQNSGGDAKYRFPPPQVFQQREKLDSRTLGYADVGNFSLSPHVDPWVIAWPRIPFWCTDPGKIPFGAAAAAGARRERSGERIADSGEGNRSHPPQRDKAAVGKSGRSRFPPPSLGWERLEKVTDRNRLSLECGTRTPFIGMQRHLRRKNLARAAETVHDPKSRKRACYPKFGFISVLSVVRPQRAKRVLTWLVVSGFRQECAIGINEHTKHGQPIQSESGRNSHPRCPHTREGLIEYTYLHTQSHFPAKYAYTLCGGKKYLRGLFRIASDEWVGPRIRAQQSLGCASYSCLVTMCYNLPARENEPVRV